MRFSPGILAFLALLLLFCTAAVAAEEEVIASHIEWHEYDNAPLYVDGEIQAVKGMYYTGSEVVRLSDGQCGVKMVRFVTWHTLEDVSALIEEGEDVDFTKMLKIPEQGMVFYPRPCEEIDKIAEEIEGKKQMKFKL